MTTTVITTAHSTLTRADVREEFREALERFAEGALHRELQRELAGLSAAFLREIREAVSTQVQALVVASASNAKPVLIAPNPAILSAMHQQPPHRQSVQLASAPTAGGGGRSVGRRTSRIFGGGTFFGYGGRQPDATVECM